MRDCEYDLKITPFFSAYMADKADAARSQRRSQERASAQRATKRAGGGAAKSLRGPCWVGMEHVWQMRRPDGADLLILGETHMAPHGPKQADVDEYVRNSGDHAIYGLLEYIAASKSDDGGTNVYAELSEQDRADLSAYRAAYANARAAIGEAQWAKQSGAMLSLHYSTIKRFYAALALDPSIADEDRVGLFYCNIRESETFCIFNLISRSDRFAEEYLRRTPHLLERAEDRREFMKRLVRKMERSFTESIKSPEDMLVFWEDMVLPERAAPQWYSEIVAELFGSASNFNRLKMNLAELRARDAAAYREATGFFFEIMERFLLGADGRSAAASDRKHARVLAKLRRRAARNADMTPAMMRDQKLIAEYFGEMLALLQDLYMVVRYELDRMSSERHVFLVGNLHSRYLCWYLEKREGAAFRGWSSQGGDVPAVFVNGPAKAVSGDTKFYSVDRMMQEYIDDPSPVV